MIRPRAWAENSRSASSYRRLFLGINSISNVHVHLSDLKGILKVNLKPRLRTSEEDAASLGPARRKGSSAGSRAAERRPPLAPAAPPPPPSRFLLEMEQSASPNCAGDCDFMLPFPVSSPKKNSILSLLRPSKTLYQIIIDN